MVFDTLTIGGAIIVAVFVAATLCMLRCKRG